MNRVAIVCVDDEEIILSSLGKQLKRNLGKEYDIELASSAEEALFLCRELEAGGIAIALVISDQLMPRMSGDEFLIKLHQTHPQTLKILLTGQAEADSVGNIVNAAALYRYISKPWDETDLLLTVREALRRYGQEQKLATQNMILKKTNRRLAKSLELLLATFEATDDGILVLDNHGKVVICNQQFISMWQISTDLSEKSSNYILGLISRRITEPFACNLARQQEPLLKLVNGNIVECYSQVQHRQGNIVGAAWGFRDVTLREAEKRKVRLLAQHDTLTELPKRRILTSQLASAIAKAEKTSSLLGIMFIDLDRFKKINDSYGYQIGDCLLQAVVTRLKQCLRREDIIARWGNDEFTLLLPQISSQQQTTAIATRILDVFKLPFQLEQQIIHVTLSIGIATYPQHASDAETLLKNADSALSQAQQLKGHNFQYYDASFNIQANKLLTLENLLHSALKKSEFLLYYQPIVNVMTGQIAKMEALIRWQNPQLGLVSPDTFIPLAEENGLIVPIGEWVLQTACVQNKAWQVQGLAPIKMSVNLSARQFQQPDLAATIANILKQTQLPPASLELEITESITIQNTDTAKSILYELNAMGISLSMDDFGTGYSSLGYLKQFPFQTLKIDRSFVKDLHPDSQDLAIVNAVLTLGKGLNLNVVAEGVETKELQDLLQNLGCEYIQGYLFSRPLPAEEATHLLRQHNMD